MNLAQPMQDIGSAIEQFNTDVQIHVMNLEARGNTTSDLLVYLFRGYKNASDETFRKYIADCEDDEPKANLSRESSFTMNFAVSILRISVGKPKATLIPRRQTPTKMLPNSS